MREDPLIFLPSRFSCHPFQTKSFRASKPKRLTPTQTQMKQFKLSSKKSIPAEPAPGPSTTRQEIDALSKQIARHIEKNPKKAAKVFDAWLNGKSAKIKDKKAA